MWGGGGRLLVLRARKISGWKICGRQEGNSYKQEMAGNTCGGWHVRRNGGLENGEIFIDQKRMFLFEGLGFLIDRALIGGGIKEDGGGRKKCGSGAHFVGSHVRPLGEPTTGTLSHYSNRSVFQQTKRGRVLSRNCIFCLRATLSNAPLLV